MSQQVIVRDVNGRVSIDVLDGQIHVATLLVDKDEAINLAMCILRLAVTR